jgi:hypothetical protein
MRSIIIYIVFIILLASCLKKYNKLSFDQMKMVMWDLNNAEELMKIKSANDSTFLIKTNRPIYYQKIFSLYQISSTDFDKNYQYYKEHPSEMKILLDSVSNFGIRKREWAIKRF